MKLFTNKSATISSLLASILVISSVACSPAAMSQPTVNVGPSSPAATSKGGQPMVTSAPTPNATVTQPAGTATAAVPPIQNIAGSYPNSNLLVDTKWLAAHLADPGLVVIDARTWALYSAGHVTGAINMPPALFDGPGVAVGDNSDLKSATELADIFGKAGVSNTNRIVVYSVGNEYAAARLFWALEYLGHKDVHVLDGGYTQWNKDGNNVVTYNSIKTATTFTATVNSSVVATTAQELASLNNSNILRVDSRNAADFIVKRIPNSINILMADYLNADSTTKSFTDMTTFFNSKAISPGKTIITNCYVGYRSSQAYFMFRLMGYTVSNYDGSSTEWFANPALPTQP